MEIKIKELRGTSVPVIFGPITDPERYKIDLLKEAFKRSLIHTADSKLELEIGHRLGEKPYADSGFAKKGMPLTYLCEGSVWLKIPKYITAARFNLSKEEVAPKIDNLELDIGIPIKRLSRNDADRVRFVARSYFTDYNDLSLGIEMRYNFNPNDSARLRKDDRMANLLITGDYFPIYLIYSSISPRHQAIARLERSGWNFLVGNRASSFMQELLNVDINRILETPSIREEIQREVNSILESLFDSYAFQRSN